ncbi:hypothetical protein KC906_01230, partial [Candidatus Kaiserbacteria bacterium]|nr:hypothetical protein [Candidatus Kaiserbacteria bacterium]
DEEETTYTVRVYAHDEAGWQSESYLEDSVTYYEPGHINCDATPPTTTYDLIVRADGTGYDLTIFCSDDGSGCTNTAKIYETDSGSACSENFADYTISKTLETPFAIDESKRICWYVEDNAQNRAFDAVDVSGNVNIELLEPRFGVSNLKSFPLLIETDIPAHCLQGEYLSTHQSMNDVQRYADLASRGAATEFDVSGAREHSVANFDVLERTAAEYFDDWLIACNASGVYNSEIFVLGYDTTPPEFELSANPNPLQEPTETSTLFTITSLDDDILCNYVQPTNAPYTPPPQRYYFYTPENPDNRDQYVQSYSTRLPENEYLFFMTSTYTTYPYFVTCYNPAGNYSE